MQTERGIPAYSSLQDCLSSMQGGNFQEYHLPYFNPKSPTILQTDALKKGLGVVLLQNSTLVMFASRALTGSKKNYQNLE